MISSVLAVAMAASMQPADTTRASREAFSACLRAYVDRVTQSRMSASEFATAYPQQCATQQTAYREAVIRRELASRMSRADAEESASLEIEDQRLNFRERFEMALVPSGSQTQTAAAPSATPDAGAPTATANAAPAATSVATPGATTAPTATPTAQPASQTTPPQH